MKRKYALVTFLILLLFIWACTHTSVNIETEANYSNNEGKLTTHDGHKFPYKFFPADQKGASVVFIPDLGGKVSYEGTSSGGWTLRKPLNKAGFNFIGFDRFDAKKIKSHRDGMKSVTSRGKSKSTMFPTLDGKESGAKNIAKNEVATVIEFIEGAPTHDKTKGIYLIGTSMGSLVSFYAVQEFPESIKGVVLVTPAIIDKMFEGARKEKYASYNWDVKFFDRLIESFGDRPALAIGGRQDYFREWLSTSTWDSAKFIKSKIGPNVELMDLLGSLHSVRLIEKDEEVRRRIVEWLTEQLKD
jgi:pimeloyl-ACP methyl ester carboxylesterase